ncbi:hypothetical protein BH10ACT11_BH10ACT11_13420 [soil metagenome]
MAALAVSNGTIIILIVIVAVPIAALSFLGAGNAFDQIGKGGLSLEPIDTADETLTAPPTGLAARDAELRQMIEAKSYRRQQKGGEPLDVDAELAKAIAQQEAVMAPAPRARSAPLGNDTQLVAEIRDHVVARNGRRERQGKEPLDVDAEVERQLRDLESLGQ